MKRRDPNSPRRFQTELPPALYQRLRVVAFEQGTSGAAIIRELLEQWAAGHDPNNDALRAAYAAGVRGERDRLRRLLDAPATAQPGLPLHPPSASGADTSTDVDMDSRCSR